MRYTLRYFLLFLMLLMFAACSGMPQLFWNMDEDHGGKASVGDAPVDSNEESRVAPEMSPEFYAESELPMAGDIGASADADRLPEKYRKAMADMAVTLDTRLYDARPDQVFSALVDAMISLNLPVNAVDSPNGIVTSDWVRKGENNPNMLDTSGVRGDPATRHRFIVRIYRASTETGGKTRLEVRVLGQAYEGKQWVNRQLKRKVSEELFTAVDEQLTRMQRPAKP